MSPPEDGARAQLLCDSSKMNKNENGNENSDIKKACFNRRRRTYDDVTLFFSERESCFLALVAQRIL